MSIAVTLVTVSVLALLLIPSRHAERSPKGPPPIQIVVLGDIGRSPRMQYHASSFLKHGSTVQLIGYLGVTI